MNFKPRGSKKTFTLSSSLGNLDFEVSGFIKAIGQHPVRDISRDIHC